MNNSINTVNPMFPPELVEPQDYVQTGEVVRLCEEFNNTVMADLLAKGRGQDLATEMTQDEAAELQFLDHLIGTLPIRNDKEVAEVHMLNIVLCDIFTDIVGRVETDDDEIVKSVPTAMATGDTALFLEKYEMKALAYYVRKAIP